MFTNLSGTVYLMLFKRYLIKPILDGKKTETRRLWKRPLVKVDSAYSARTNFRKNSVFATIKITYIKRERLGAINYNGIKKEGCRSLEEFKKIWIDIYGSWQPSAEVFVIGFQVI